MTNYFHDGITPPSPRTDSNCPHDAKDFKPLSLGTLRLEKGRGTLKLDALEIKGKRVVDVHSVDLIAR